MGEHDDNDPTNPTTTTPAATPAHDTGPNDADATGSAAEFQAGLSIETNGLILAHGSTGRANLSRWIASGRAIQLAAGAAILAERWKASTWPERRWLRCAAHALANPGLVLIGVSAARIHGLAILDDPDRDTGEKVHLGRLGSGRRRTAADHEVRPIGDADHDVTIVDGARVTTVARTIHDLRESHGPEHALAAADDALRRGHSRGDFAELADRLIAGRKKGARGTATIMALASELSESAAESWTRWILHVLGIAGVLQQVWIVAPDGRPVRRVDFWIPALEMVIEFHGRMKYDGRYGDGDVISTRENIAMRDLANLGIDTVQLTWRMLVDGSAHRLIVEKVARRREALRTAGPQFKGETFMRHEKLPDHVTRHFNGR
ncbi:hypothetical protein [uncultured Corynebacterium sp.]|uniref:hypothetical protein n=1 Tax=uncultured Corynebacterium sp. TaxID=159447 RepID=UPI0025E27B84|nr:hypothetical protein [uncultured Corynebacterium sp.]